jgi:hypothetical protein
MSERINAAAKKAKSVLNVIAGIINPPISAPPNLYAWIIIPFTKTVSRYRTKELVKIEKRPSVITLNGKLMMSNRGLTMSIISVSITPAKISVPMPPARVTPGTTYGRRKSATV